MVIEKLATIWNRLHPGLLLTLLTDNLSFHRDPDTIEKALNNNIHMFFLPPNTSHFTQPLDDLLFAIYKAELAKHGRKLVQALYVTKEKLNAMLVLTAVTIFAQHVAFSSDNIILAFERVGLSFDESGRWDPSIMIARARANISATMDTPPTVEEQVSKLAEKAVIAKFKEHRDVIEKVNTSTRTVTVTTQYQKMYDSTSILEAHYEQVDALELKNAAKEAQQVEKAALQEEKAQKKRQREEDFFLRTCRVGGCTARYCQSRNHRFMWCEHCPSFGVCPNHFYGETIEAEEGRRVLSAHEEACLPATRPKKKQKLK
jgi:hypothetical protein